MAKTLMNRARPCTTEMVFLAEQTNQLFALVEAQPRVSTAALARQVGRRTRDVSRARRLLVKTGLLYGSGTQSEPAYRLIDAVTLATTALSGAHCGSRRGRRRFVADLIQKAARLLPTLRALRGEGNVRATVALAWEWHALRTGRTYNAPRAPTREHIREAADLIARLMERHDALEDSWQEIKADRQTFVLNVDLCVRPLVAYETELFRALKRLHSLTCEDPQ